MTTRGAPVRRGARRASPTRRTSHARKPPARARRDTRPLLLAGDIGGTKTHIALFELPPRAGAAGHEGNDHLELVDSQRFASAEHPGLESILEAFLSPRRARVVSAGFGIAGPVVDGRSETTNLPWVVDAEKLSRVVRAPVALVNDLEATAHSLALLGPRSFLVLNKGRKGAHGNLALIAAGTGLGEAFVLRGAGRHVVGASEGGHCDFAPRNAGEIELLRYLMERFGHVSVERVLSGPGLVNVYEFIGAMGWIGDDPSVSERLLREDRAAVISSSALDGTSARATEALRQFVSIYGAESGNLALKVVATGGVFVGGGIAPKILPALEEPRFMDAFVDKGRFRDFLKAIPVKVILDDRAALIGAARLAFLQLA